MDSPGRSYAVARLRPGGRASLIEAEVAPGLSCGLIRLSSSTVGPASVPPPPQPNHLTPQAETPTRKHGSGLLTPSATPFPLLAAPLCPTGQRPQPPAARPPRTFRPFGFARCARPKTSLRVKGVARPGLTSGHQLRRPEGQKNRAGTNRPAPHHHHRRYPCTAPSRSRHQPEPRCQPSRRSNTGQMVGRAGLEPATVGL